MRPTPTHYPAAIIHFALLLSGLAGLGYEIVWTRMFAAGLGHELPSVLAVVAAFFGGFALGAWVLDGPVSRSPRPGRWYAGLEMIIAGWALAAIYLIPWVNGRAMQWIGLAPSDLRHWAVAFGVPLITLLPATCAMGATLPALDRLCGRLRPGGRAVGGLYAANTFGAVAGTLASTFWLIPALGHPGTVLSLAACNLVCAALAWWGFAHVESRVHGAAVESAAAEYGSSGIAAHSSAPRKAERRAAVTAPPSMAAGGAVIASPSVSGRGAVALSPAVPTRGAAEDPSSTPPRAMLHVALFMTGLLGIGYEVLAVRVSAQIFENTVYSFAAALAMYLLGTAVGAGLYQLLARGRHFEALWTPLLAGLSMACALGIPLLHNARSMHDHLRAVLGSGVAASITAEMMVAAAAFAAPTLLMGAAFSHLAQWARTPAGGLGVALGLNTLGACLAPALFGVLLLSAWGSKAAWLIQSAGYLLLLPRFNTRWLIGPAALLAVLLFVPRDLVLIQHGAGEQVVAVREGPMATAAVLQNAAGERTLKVNDRFQMGGSGTGEFSERRQGHIPLLLHPGPRRCLFLGLGTGITFAAAADHPGLEGEGVELLPEVVALLGLFEPANAAILHSPRLSVRVADARRYVQASSAQYDVIVADLFHPARDGAGSLYTVEHFEAVHHRLAAGGLFCQWLPLYQMDEAVLKVVIRSFLKVFPHSRGFLAYFNINTPMLGLVGTPQPSGYAPGWVEQRTRGAPERGAASPLHAALERLALGSDLQLFGCYVAPAGDLARFAGEGPLNTDAHPVVTYAAPEAAYRDLTAGPANLLNLIRTCRPDPGSLLAGHSTQSPQPAEDDFGRRLAAYIAARDAYLEGAYELSAGRLSAGIDRLLDSVRASPDFEASYENLLLIAREGRLNDSTATQRMLQAMDQARPDRPEARRLLESADPP